MCSLRFGNKILRCWCLHARDVAGQFQRFEVMPFDEVVLHGVLTGTDGWESQLLYVRHGDSGGHTAADADEHGVQMRNGFDCMVNLRPSQSEYTQQYCCQYKTFVSHRVKSSLTRVRTRW